MGESRGVASAPSSRHSESNHAINTRTGGGGGGGESLSSAELLAGIGAAGIESSVDEGLDEVERDVSGEAADDSLGDAGSEDEEKEAEEVEPEDAAARERRAAAREVLRAARAARAAARAADEDRRIGRALASVPRRLLARALSLCMRYCAR